jgi:hypothetical protein
LRTDGSRTEGSPLGGGVSAIRLDAPYLAHHSLQVLRRRPAAAADDADAEVAHELGERAGHRLGLERVDGVAGAGVEREPGVGDARDGARRVLAEEADGLAHVLGAGRAVEADHVDA